MAASYPVSVKSFLTYQNQPGDSNHIMTDGTDLTIDHARITNEIHDEVVAIEKALGVPGPTKVAPHYPSMSAGVQALYNAKAPLTHSHVHHDAAYPLADDHPQYVRVDGHRGFSNPVSAPHATSGADLIPLGQVQGFGYQNAEQVRSIISSTMSSRWPHPIKGPTASRYKMTGGFFNGYTDTRGMVFIDFGPARFSRIVSFVFMKNPYPLASYYYGYIFQYEEDQLILDSLTPQGAWIQFREDILVDRQANVALTWIALGV